jgi:hypothetical protein
MQSVIRHPWRPFSNVLPHGVDKVASGLVDIDGNEARIKIQPELYARIDTPGFDAQPDRRRIGMGIGLQVLTGTRGADGPFDADHRGLAERHTEIEIVGERGLDDLFLNSP